MQARRNYATAAAEGKYDLRKPGFPLRKLFFATHNGLSGGSSVGKCAIVHVSSSLHSVKLITAKSLEFHSPKLLAFLLLFPLSRSNPLNLWNSLRRFRFFISLFDAKEEISSPANFSSSSKFVCVFFCLL